MGTLNSACRAMLRSAVVCAGLVAASLAATSAQAADKVSIAGLTTDLGGVPLVVLGQDKELQGKHNIEVDVKLFPTVPTVWTAFTAGEFDMLPGGARPASRPSRPRAGRCASSRPMRRPMPT